MRELLRYLLRPRARYLLAWALAVISAGITLFCAWTMFDKPRSENYASRWHRGNSGHVAIDFGGQWLMGRMLARGLGRHLYHRNYLREIVREAYPRADEIPSQERPVAERDVHDAENLMEWLMGHDDPEAARAIASFLAPLAGHDTTLAIGFAFAQQHRPEERVRQATMPQVGGALYPPIHALLMYPLGLLRPAPAYRITQILGILLALLAGGGICLLSEGRIWWPMGVAAVVLFPGFATSLNLGQNSILMLTLLIWGWVLLARDHPVAGGMLWGLMAFKPVWAAAFFLVPLLSRRWRFCAAMLVTGLGLAAVTLPWVGWHSWLDWLQVGRYASEIYATNRNWIFLSRDLLGIPRRWLLDFHDDYAAQPSSAATMIGWGLLFAVMACTAALSISRHKQSRALTGPPAAFLHLGAWLSCYHFMYYDVLLTALPVALLLTEPRRYLNPVFVAVAILPEEMRKHPVLSYYQPGLVCTPPSSSVLQVGYQNVCVRNSMTLTLIALLAISDLLLTFVGIEISISATSVKHAPFPLPVTLSTAFAGTPWPTFCLLALWLWCGWLWVNDSPRRSQRNAEEMLLCVPPRPLR
jgi:arabinofuranan 3-O-arabinosyltransferase